MALTTHAWSIRKIDLADFEGDEWAVDDTLAEPPEDVPRLFATGGPVEWAVYAMTSGADDAEMVAEVTTTLSTCMVKLATTPKPAAKVLVRPCVAVSGTVLNHPIVEADVSRGDVFVLAVPAITVDDATWLWIVPHSGFTREPS